MSAATGGMGRMSHLELLSAVRYTGIEDRIHDVERVKGELQVVIDAIPTQIHPDEREAYLEAILADLEDREGAAWTEWPEDVYLLALTAIRFLARNPVGSTTLLDPSHLRTILHHTSLPFPAPVSPFSYPSPPAHSPQAIEALKIIANLLVLHPSARDLLGKAGGMKALTLALAGKDEEGLILDDEAFGPEREAERVFLLARLGFLGTVERPEVVRTMVDQGGIVQSISYYLSHFAAVQANYTAIAEVLKLAMNVLRYYPAQASGSQSTEQWDGKSDILLPPLLVLLHTLPTSTLAPPLSTTLHTLLSVPFLPRLLPTWHAIPEPPSPASSTNSVRSLIHRISNIGNSSSNKRSSIIGLGSRSGSFNHTTADEGKELGLGLSGHNPRSSRPKSPSSPRDPPFKPKERQIRVIPTIPDPSAFPLRILKILDTWFDAYMPYHTKPDEIDSKVMVDEVIPPILLLMARAAEGSGEFRRVFKEQLLPLDLDRSPNVGSLESRRGTLGNLLRLMQCSNHFASRNSAGEFLWAVCDSDAATLTAEIGYGNAAGFLFQKGISAPPPGKIQDLPSSPISTSTYRPPSSLTPDIPRHPISSLSEPLPQSCDIPMTPEEKEREAERLFVLFERMEKNPIISMSSDDSGEKKKGVREMMRDKLESGATEDWDKQDGEEERYRMEQEERDDEEEVRREMKRYKKRMGR